VYFQEFPVIKKQSMHKKIVGHSPTGNITNIEESEKIKVQAKNSLTLSTSHTISNSCYIILFIDDFWMI
jgi:hypothetical protein